MGRAIRSADDPAAAAASFQEAITRTYGAVIERGCDPLRELDQYAEAFERLAAAGYAGPVLVEMWNDDAPDSVQQLAAARGWVIERMLEGGLATEGTDA